MSEDFSKEAREVLDGLYSHIEDGYVSDRLSKEAIGWLYSVAYKEFRKRASSEAERQIKDEQR